MQRHPLLWISTGLIPSMKNELADMIDALVMPVKVQIDKKVEPES
jgi:hypothetical protein